MTHLSQFFERLLDLSSPFSISEVREISSNGKIEKIQIAIEFSRSHIPQKEGWEYVRIHDWEPREWLHLQIFQYPCYITCKVPKHKFKNKQTGKEQVTTYEVPWAQPGSGFTELFVEMVLEDLQRTGIPAVTATRFGIHPNTIWRIFHASQPDDCYCIENQSFNLSEVRKVAYDESARKKGHSYNTYFYDMESKLLLGIAEGKSSETVGTFVEKASKKGLEPAKITDVSIDMSKAFTKSVSQYFPNANITYDKFHVSQLVNRAFDKVRKAIATSHHTRFNKWVFFKSNLDAEEQILKSELLETYPELAEAYQHKQDFFNLWRLESPAFFKFWVDRCREFDRKAFETMANTMDEHFNGIVQVFQSKLNNGLLEGLNEKIQLLKRKARGYKYNTTFMKMIWFHCQGAKVSTQME